MTNTGAFLWIMAIVLLIFGLLRKNREESDGHEYNEDHQPDDQELEKGTPAADTRQHRKGCCG
jgi:hypothetical protein